MSSELPTGYNTNDHSMYNQMHSTWYIHALIYAHGAIKKDPTHIKAYNLVAQIPVEMIQRTTLNI